MNTPTSNETELLTEARDALRRVILDPTASPNSIAKASSELRHLLQRLTELQATTPPDPQTDPIEALKLRTITTPNKATR